LIWLLVLGAVAWGAWERVPRLSHSYWNDEAYSLNRYVRGAWEKQEDGRTVFEPVTWTDTLFENRQANNHLLNSLLSRISLDLWRSATGAAPDAFRESVTRLPNFLAGLGTIFLMFLLGRAIGSPLAGVAAAWLLALHPWHIRYAVEMRGYSLMLFFVALALLALVRALRTDGIRWWLLFAASEALFLLSFPGALYVAMAVNGLCAIELMARKDWRKTGTLAAFNALAAIPVLQWMLPSIPQMIKWLHKDQPAYVSDVSLWLRDLASVLAAGWQYENTYRDQQVGTDWQEIATHFFFMPPTAVAITLAVLFLFGLAIAMWHRPASRLVVIAPVIAALISLAINLRPGSPMTVWYLIYLLLPATLAVPLALLNIGRLTKARWLAPALCLAFTVFYGMGTSTAAAALRNHDRQPMRETIAFIHAQGANVMTATFGVSDRQHSAYDPEVTVLDSEADLTKCMKQSAAAKKPLYVYFCSDEQGLKRDAGIYNRVTKSGDFERVKDFPGSEELWSYRVFRLK
jgi:4-amino-4-deoxy-L-arabinose transferase-like glycosyltransferase